MKDHGYLWVYQMQSRHGMSKPLLIRVLADLWPIVCSHCGNDLLFAGTQDGTILAWKFNAVVNSFEPAASLKGHNLAVVTLVVGANRLYSGSMDNSIRVWSLETLQCVQTLPEHTSVMMSVLCWNQFLLSCSLDKTIKVWVAAESGNLEVTYTHNEEHFDVVRGMKTGTGKGSVTFRYTKYEGVGFCYEGGLFFTGDGSGEVRVWKWLTEPTATA